MTSIRWEGFRMGMQDGQILLYLKDCLKKGKCSGKTAGAIKTLLARAEEFGREGNYTFEGINDIFRRATQLVLDVETSPLR